MRIQVASEEKDWVEAVSTWVHSHVKSGEKVFLPAGNTPLAVYKQWSASPSALLQSLSFLQIDDIMNGPQKGVFRDFFESEMKPYLPQFQWIAEASDLADVAILGVGVNGHVAFHEPKLPRDFFSGCVALSDETRGYLNLNQPTWGLTYGVASFLACRKILLLARGETKRKVLEVAAQNKLPVSWIMQHPDVTLISDFNLDQRQAPTAAAF